jgi:hypothetical protein
MKKPAFMAWFWTDLGFDHVKRDPIEVQVLAGKWGVHNKWLYQAVHGGYLRANTSKRPWVVSRAEALRFENERIVPLMKSFADAELTPAKARNDPLAVNGGVGQSAQLS